jgi:acyl-CoA thioesterase I
MCPMRITTQARRIEIRRAGKVSDGLGLISMNLLFVSRIASATLVLALSTVLAIAAERPGAAHRPQCTVSPAAISAGPWFTRTAARLSERKPVTIVAVGSSSTYGEGASSSAAAYPARLEALLKQRFPATAIKVLNRGVNGEEAADMLARFERDVIAAKPDLVLWQVGTNAVLSRLAVTGQVSLLRQGIERLKAVNADVMLIDPQYAPMVIAKPQAQHMVDLIGFEASEEGAGVLRRFALMRNWHEVRHMRFIDFVASDGLHMNDWGYDCIARQLANAIGDAVAKPPTTTAAVTASGR